jgi:hypothetical protein
LQVEGCAKSMNTLIAGHVLDENRFFRGYPTPSLGASTTPMNSRASNISVR